MTRLKQLAIRMDRVPRRPRLGGHVSPAPGKSSANLRPSGHMLRRPSLPHGPGLPPTGKPRRQRPNTTVQPLNQICHLARMRTDPFSLPTIVEHCSMSVGSQPRRLSGIVFHGMVFCPRTNARIFWVRKPGDYANLFPPDPRRDPCLILYNSTCLATGLISSGLPTWYRCNPFSLRNYRTKG